MPYGYMVTGASQLFTLALARLMMQPFIRCHHENVFPMIPEDTQVSNSSCISSHLHQFSISLNLHVLNNPLSKVRFLSHYPPPSNQVAIQQARANQVVPHSVILPFQLSIALHRPLSQPRKSTKAPVLQTARPNPISASIWLHYGSGFPL